LYPFGQCPNAPGLTGKKAERDWRHQVEHLAITHTSSAATTMDEAKQARYRQPAARDPAWADELPISKAEPANEPLTPCPTPAEWEQQLARQNTISWLLPQHRETLAARAVRAGGLERRVAELERVLSAARDALLLLESEKRSRQASLNLLASDHSRLKSRLAESDDALEAARSQLEQFRTILAAVEADRKKLSIAVEALNAKRQTEAHALNVRLEAMSVRAATAETLLAEARQTLLARAVEANRAVTELANETAARHAAEKKLEPLREAVRAQERHVHELEQARSKLIEDAGALVRSVEARDAALARADGRAKLSDAAPTEAAASPPKPQKIVQEPMSRTQHERKGRTVQEGIRKKADADQSLLKRDLDRDDWLLGGR
jgi:crescentin